MPTEQTFTLGAYQFMRAHAGYSYRPATGETADMGRVNSALAYARAEYALRQSGTWVQWERDDDADTSWLDVPTWADHKAAHERGDYVLMRAILYAYDDSGEVQVRASLWGIDLQADWYADPYRRVVESELALEAGICHPLDRAIS